ncbi:MAG: tRNA (guanosine(37)-N1)-methyltransferase TrmD [Anaerolineales bacterium]|uniref:tRNA (guanosine(37)-N1)-methyltransferase TrmD n=1 Tax=Candidatus Villigracilis vicinus TaxID=3140679 RepID=UPI0031373BCA|nr:tRNA (guanosine(37)-N1)-methyltransferase TrmD [Anaerolineales bacterium]MBK9779768.1 tRNA (guanosine(37)-N1)-methyltransferase TrmD [Anaerolineales bacterium]
MQFEVFTLLPEVFPSYLETSILKRARERGLIHVNVHNIRNYTHDRHHTTDDTPYGGGGGMVMKPEPVFEAIETVLGIASPPSTPELESPLPIILLTPQGRVFNQSIAKELSQHSKIVLLCGRYEGIDERIRQNLVTDEISIGDYVLTGGEIPALILIDAISRLLPDVLGDPTGAEDDSHAMGLLEYPHYTRPPEFRGSKVPDVLLSGDHAKIDKWRREQALERTFKKRPDMLEKADLSEADKKFIKSLKSNIE